MKEIRELKWYWPYFWVITLSLVILWHFSNMVRLGSFYIQETNPFILWGEIIFFVGLTAWAVRNIIKEVK